MSELVGEAVIHVRTDSTGVDVAGEGKKAGGSYARGFAGNLKGIAAGILGALAVREVIDFAKDAVAEGREAQKVGAATQQLIKTTGGAANVTAGQMGQLTSAISAKIGVDDEAIQSAANLVLAFKNVRNEAGKGNAVFDRTIQAGQDLAAAGFGSATSASKGLAKALDDPVKGMAALTRLGVRLTESQQDQVKAFVESGDTLSAQKLILDQIEGKVGGVAAATATAGERSAVAWDNVKEAVGTALLPALDAAESAFADKVAPAIIGALDGSSRFGQGMRVVGRVVGDAFHAISDAAAPVVSKVIDLAQAALPAVRDAVADMLPPILDLAGALADDVGQAIENLLPILEPLIAAAFNLVGSFRVAELSVVSDVLKTIGDVLVSVTAFLGEHETAVQAVLVAIVAMVAAYQAYSAVMAIVRIATAAFTAVQAALNVVMSLNPIGIVVLALVGLAAGLIYAYKHSEKFREIVDGVFSFLKDAVPAAIGFIVDFVKNHWGLLVSIIGGPLGIVVVQVIKHFGAIKAFVSTVIDDVVKIVTFLPSRIIQLGAKLLEAGKSIMGKFLDGLKSAGSFASGIADAVWGAVKGVINSAIDQLNGLLEFSITVGPKTFHVNPPNIGHLAGGTDNWRGGMSWVGEQGPELLRLPAGSQVIPAGRSAAIAGAGVIDYDAMARAFVKAGLGARQVTLAPQLPTGDPEAAAMAMFNRLAAAGAF